MRATHMHTRRPRIWAGQPRSRSTCSCAGRRRPSRCTALWSASRSSCSSRSRPERSSPPGCKWVSADTCRATGRIAASRPQPIRLEEPAAHCSGPSWGTVGERGQRSGNYSFFLFFLKKILEPVLMICKTPFFLWIGMGAWSILWLWELYKTCLKWQTLHLCLWLIQHTHASRCHLF